MKRQSSGIDLDLTTIFEPLFGFDHWCIAYSGGLDSSVLLHMAWRFIAKRALASASTPTLTAIHIDHQLMPEHQRWADHCAEVCSNYKVALVCEQVAVHTNGKGIEQAARVARYRVFEQHMGSDTVLLMGHHANDQAETLILRLMRGAGVRGAAAIPVQRPLGNGVLHRPLLNFSRAQLCNYAQQHNLSYIEDPSNKNTRLDRNFVRHDVLPVLEKRWPKAHQTLARFAKHSAEAELLIRDLARIDLQTIQNVGEWGEYLELAALNLLSVPRRANALRHWLTEKEAVQINAKQLEALLDLCDKARGASCINVQHSNNNTKSYDFSLHVFNKRLYCVDENKINFAGAASGKLNLPLQNILTTDQTKHQRLNWAGVACIDAQASTEYSSSMRIKAGEFDIAVRQSGMHARLNGHTKTLKKLMQELGIPPWLRDIYPVIYAGGTVAAIGDKCVCDEYKAGKEDGWQLKLNWL